MNDEVHFFKGPSDTLYGRDGNDTLFDGNRSDFIDPGNGNNYITLQEDDGSGDVVIRAPGAQNAIWGGSNEDRIAIRLSDFETNTGVALGGDTQAIALLGGFVSPGGTNTYVQHVGLEEVFGQYYTTLDIQVDYTKHEDTLYAHISVNPGGNWVLGDWVPYDIVNANFVIHQFEEGDSGIYLKPLGSDGDGSVYASEEDIAYFNNNGRFLDVPGEYIA